MPSSYAKLTDFLKNLGVPASGNYKKITHFLKDLGVSSSHEEKEQQPSSLESSLSSSHKEFGTPSFSLYGSTQETKEPNQQNEYKIITKKLAEGHYGVVYKGIILAKEADKLYQNFPNLFSMQKNVLVVKQAKGDPSSLKSEGEINDFLFDYYQQRNLDSPFCDTTYILYQGMPALACHFTEFGSVTDFLPKYRLLYTPEQLGFICVNFSHDIVEALKALHLTFNIAHRDIDTDNMLVYLGTNNFPKVKITDFGLAAKMADPNVLEGLPQSNLRIRAMDFVAFWYGLIGLSTDIFSVKRTLYQMWLLACGLPRNEIDEPMSVAMERGNRDAQIGTDGPELSRMKTTAAKAIDKNSLRLLFSNLLPDEQEMVRKNVKYAFSLSQENHYEYLAYLDAQLEIEDAPLQNVNFVSRYICNLSEPRYRNEILSSTYLSPEEKDHLYHLQETNAEIRKFLDHKAFLTYYFHSYQYGASVEDYIKESYVLFEEAYQSYTNAYGLPSVVELPPLPRSSNHQWAPIFTDTAKVKTTASLLAQHRYREPLPTHQPSPRNSLDKESTEIAAVPSRSGIAENNIFSKISKSAKSVGKNLYRKLVR